MRALGDLHFLRRGRLACNAGGARKRAISTHATGSPSAKLTARDQLENAQPWLTGRELRARAGKKASYRQRTAVDDESNHDDHRDWPEEPERYVDTEADLTSEWTSKIKQYLSDLTLQIMVMLSTLLRIFELALLLLTLVALTAPCLVVIHLIRPAAGRARRSRPPGDDDYYHYCYYYYYYYYRFYYRYF